MSQPDFIAAYLVDPNTPKEPLYLLLKRSDHSYLPGIWQMVTGKVEASENAIEAVRREIQEETGLAIDDLFNVDVTMFYNQSKNKISYSANFVGYVDHNQSILLSGSEHSEFLWASLTEACSLLAFPSQKMTLEFIHRYFVLEKPNPVNQA